MKFIWIRSHGQLSLTNEDIFLHDKSQALDSLEQFFSKIINWIPELTRIYNLEYLDS